MSLSRRTKSPDRSAQRILLAWLFLHPPRAHHAAFATHSLTRCPSSRLSLNTVLQIYKERNFARVLGSWVALYLLYVPFHSTGDGLTMILNILDKTASRRTACQDPCT